MSNLLDHFPLRKSAIYIHSIFNHPIINPPTGSTELPGSKASRWRRGGGSPSWDKICNGPVKGLKTEWQALPRGSVAPFSGFDFEPNCGLRKGGNGFFGWGRILFPWKINKKTTLKIVLFQLVLYQKKMIKIPPRWSQIIGLSKASFVAKVSFTYAPRCCGVSLLLSCAEAMRHRPISLFFRGS